jgi:hypothetical protein
MMHQLGIMTCKEIREHLDNTTSMTDAEKVTFVEQNLTGRKALRAYMQKQHLSVADMHYYANAGRTILNALGNHTKEVYSVLFDAADLSDRDCVYLVELMRTQAHKKSKAKQAEEEARLSKMGILKRGLVQAVNATVGSAKTVANLAWQGTKMVGKALYTGVSYLVAWVASVGFQLWTWIARNPRAAYFTLLMLKQLKQVACRGLGDAFGWLAGPAETVRAGVLRMIRLAYPDYVPPPQTSLQDLWGMVTGVFEFEKNQVILKATGIGLNSIFSFAKANIGNLAGMAIGTLTVNPIIGAAVAGAVNMVVGAAADLAKDTTQSMLEEALYLDQANSAFKMLFEVMDPVACLKEMSKQATVYIKDLPISDTTAATPTATTPTAATPAAATPTAATPTDVGVVEPADSAETNQWMGGRLNPLNYW